jgi:hypothetical protein
MCLETLDDKEFFSHFQGHLSDNSTWGDNLLKVKEG